MDYHGYELIWYLTLCLFPYFVFKYVVYISLSLGSLYLIWYLKRRLEADVDFTGTAVLITGCDSGFGYDIAKKLHSIGFTVFAGCLEVDGYGASQLKKISPSSLHVISLDVTSDDSVNTSLEYVLKNLPKKGLWGVINNAGINMHGETELVTLGQFKTVVNINLYGPIRVAKAFLPLIRQSKGRVVMVTSVQGRFTHPARCAYAVSKHGIETLSDSLRLEMVKFGVKVAIIEPGKYGHATLIHGEMQRKRLLENVEEMWKEATEEVKQVYGKEYMQSWVDPSRANWTSLGDTGPVIKAAQHALVSQHPKSRYLVGGTDVLVDVSVYVVYISLSLGSLYLIWYLKRRLEADVDFKGTAVLITGCDSGFGYDIAKRLHSIGFTVFAGCLEVDGYGASQLKKISPSSLHVISLDVTSDDSVNTSLEYVMKNLPKKGLWGVINNAGINMHGEAELVTLGHFKRVVNINLYGPIRVAKAFLPLIRQSKGRVVMVTSVQGRFTYPARCAYAVSKYGLETLSDSLRLEMMKFGVKVAIIEPGRYGHATLIHSDMQRKRLLENVEEMWKKATEEVKQVYGKQYMQSWVEASNADWTSRGDTGPVIKATQHALVSQHPKSRYLISGTNVLVDFTVVLATFNGVVPSWMIDWYLKRRTGCHTFKR